MQTQSEQRFTPLELEFRPTVDTATYAHYMHIAQQTARIHACKETGPIRPLRIPGSAKLHWPTADIRRVLGVTAFTGAQLAAIAGLDVATVQACLADEVQAINAARIAGQTATEIRQLVNRLHAKRLALYPLLGGA